MRDLGRCEFGRSNLAAPAEVILDAVARDDRVMMKALNNHDPRRARFEQGLAPSRQRRVALQQLVGISELPVEVEIRVKDDHGLVWNNGRSCESPSS